MSDTSNRRPEAHTSGSVNDHVVALIKEGFRGRIPPAKIAELRRKLSNDDMVDAIQTAYYEGLEEDKKRAAKFVKFIDEKTRDKNMPLHIVLKKAAEYKTNKNLTDIQFAEFKYQYEKLYTSRTGSNSQESFIPSTTMSLLFGDIYSIDGITVRESDFPALTDILKLHTMTRGTHSQVIMQSMQYQGFDSAVKHAEYDATRHNPTYALHPVVAAMFAPKMKGFDDHFLFTNISYIVKCKYERERIMSLPDQMLLHSMIVDSNDVVCSTKSAIHDLRMRANVQNNLWNCVLQMRSGKFFEVVSNDFFSSIEECKIFRQDNPDLTYTGDESIIMRRLLAAMSFNPIIVSTIPVFGLDTMNPAGFPVINNSVVARPFFTVRIPDAESMPDGDEPNITLEDSVKRPQVYKEDGMYVPKTQKIINVTSGVLIFHVPRRSIISADAFTRFIDPRPKFTQIPLHVLANERLNSFKIGFSPVIVIDNKTFSFVSGVVLETPMGLADTGGEERRNKIILGCSAIVRDSGVASRMNFGAPYHIYSPKTLPGQFGITGASANIKKVWEDCSGEAEDILAMKGTIYIYEQIDM